MYTFPYSTLIRITVYCFKHFVPTVSKMLHLSKPLAFGENLNLPAAQRKDTPIYISSLGRMPFSFLTTTQISKDPLSGKNLISN